MFAYYFFSIGLFKIINLIGLKLYIDSGSELKSTDF